MNESFDEISKETSEFRDFLAPMQEKIKELEKRIAEAQDLLTNRAGAPGSGKDSPDKSAK